jgi:sec-independent protein translocase protein TatB
MLLDPAKLLLIGVVALVVLGPEKLPAAAQRVSSLMKDLQRVRASLQGEVHKAVEELPFGPELRSAREAIGQVTQAVDPRQALYRAAGLAGVPGTPGGEAGASAGGEREEGTDPRTVPGSTDLSVELDPSQN